MKRKEQPLILLQPREKQDDVWNEMADNVNHNFQRNVDDLDEDDRRSFCKNS